MKVDHRQVGLLYTFASFIPNGCYVDLGGLARVGRKENGERYMELYVDGHRVSADFKDIAGIYNKLGSELLDKKLEDKGVNRELLSTLLRRKGKDPEKVVSEIQEKHVHRILSFLKIELSAFLSAIERVLEGTSVSVAGYTEGQVPLAIVYVLRNVFSEFEMRDLKYGFRGNNAVLKSLEKALDNIKITAFTHSKHVEEEGLKEALKEVGEILLENMKPLQRQRMDRNLTI